MHDKANDTVTDEEYQRAATEVYHIHLPQLTAAGLVEYDSDENTIGLTDHSAFNDAGIVDVLDKNTDASENSLDNLFRALSTAPRRTILNRLNHQIGPIYVETLAREIEADAQEIRESQVPRADVERQLLNLRHSQLPYLADAGLIDYETDRQMVEYIGHPELDVAWTHSVLQPDLRQSLTGEVEPAGIGEIEGRE